MSLETTNIFMQKLFWTLNTKKITTISQYLILDTINNSNFGTNIYNTGIDMARSVDYKIIQGTSPILEGVLRDAKGKPFDLTGYSLHFTWFHASTGVYKDDIACVVDDPPTGAFRINMGSIDTSKETTPAGLWLFQLTAVNGDIIKKWPLKNDDEIDNFGTLLVAKDAKPITPST